MANISSDPQVRFPDRLALRAPRGLQQAVEVAADRHHTNPSEWLRQAVLRALRDDGVQLRDGQVEVQERAR